MAETDRLGAYSNWLVTNKDKQGTPEFETVANAYRSLRQQPGGINPDTDGPMEGFGAAFKSGIDAPLENIGETLEAVGATDAGANLRGLTDAPEGYASASERFINDPAGEDKGFGWRYLPKAVVEQAGQLGGSLVTRAGGAAVGAAAGSVIPGAGTVGGAAVGAFAGPALFESIQVLGPVANARARNDGRDKPNLEDFVYASGTAAGMGALNAIGVRGGSGITSALREGGTEALQSVTEQTGSSVNTESGLSVDSRQAVGEGIIGGASMGAVGAARGAVNRPAPAPREDTPEARAEATFAQRIRGIVEANGIDLRDVNTGSTTGAREAVDKSHIQIAEDLKQVFSDLKGLVKTTDLDALELVQDKVLAQAAYREGKNKTKSVVGKQEFDALDRLTGQTLEGQRALNLLREMNVLTKIHNDGYKGGLSQYTDTANPFDTSQNTYNAAAQISGKVLGPLATATAAYSTGGASIPIQAGVALGGRGIDKVTGRRSRLNRFVKQNANNPGIETPSGLPSIRQDRIDQATEAQRTEEAKAVDAAARTEALKQTNLDLARKGAPPVPTSPQGTVEAATGLDRSGVARILRVIQATNQDPLIQNAIEGYQGTVAVGGRVPDISPLIRAINHMVESQPAFKEMRVREPDTGATQAAPGAPIQTTSENYQRGIDDNKAMLQDLKDGAKTDATMSKVDKAKVLEALDQLGMNLGSDPGAKVNEIMGTLEGVEPDAVAQFVEPYVMRVMGQQDAAPRNSTQFELPPAENAQRTQITATKPTYEKALKALGDQGSAIDFGAGRGFSSEMGMDTYEPFPREGFSPDYTDASAIPSGAYDRLTNLNVLNVVPRKTRDGIVRDIGRVLAPGGKAIITTRGRDVMSAKGAKGDEPMSIVTSIGTYQKGFTQPELREYIQETLGPDFSVKTIQGMGAAGVEVQKSGGSVRNSAPRPEFGGKTDVSLGTSLANAFDMAKGQVFAKGRDFKLVLQEKSLEAQKREGIDLTTLDDANIDRLADFVFEDALEALKDNANAIGWYDRTITKALETVGQLHPEVLTDPKAKLQLIWAVAVTSNGLKVDKNFNLALDVYQGLKDTGRFPSDAGIGEAAKAINGGLQQYHTMVDQFSRLSNSDEATHSKLIEFMNGKFKVKDLEKEYGVKISGEGKNTEVRGASILGPKIGNGFFSNLYGNFDELTMDRWLMRTVGRWRGSLVDINKPMIKKKTSEIQGILASADLKAMKPLFTKALINPTKKMTKANTEILATQIAKLSMKPEWRTAINAIPGGVDLRTAGNGLAKYLDGQVEAPAGANERTFIREVFQRGLKRLQESPQIQQGSNTELTMSDLQALLWYPEKRLYDTAKQKDGGESRGYEDDEAPDYANAARKAVAERTVGDRLGSAGATGPGGRGPSGPNAGSTRQSVPGGILSGGANPSNNPVRSRAPEVPEVKQQTALVNASIEIGKPGSEFENGIKDMAGVEKLAAAYNIVLKFYNSSPEMLRAIPEADEGATGAYHPNKRTANVVSTGDLRELITALHETMHGVGVGSVLTGTFLGDLHTTNGLTGQSDVMGVNSLESVMDFVLGKGKSDPLRREILSELKHIQERAMFSTSGVQAPIRGAQSMVMMLKDAKRDLEADGQSFEAQKATVRRQLKDHQNYERSIGELTVDALQLYAHDPKTMKRVAPQTARMVRELFQKSGNKKIQFYSHPLAMVVAVVMAIMAKAGMEDEEEQQIPPGMLSPQPGMLTA